MKNMNEFSEFANSRRKFMGKLAATAGIASFSTPLFADSFVEKPTSLMVGTDKAEKWMQKIKGSHRILFDAPEPHDGFPIIWTWAYYLTNNQTGTKDNDMTAVVVLRHNAIPFAMKDELWQEYKLGEAFHINDSRTNLPSVRNTMYEFKAGDLPIDGIDGIKTLQERGAMFCVCDLALTVYSGFTARNMELNPEKVKNDWVAGLLPGVQVVPSGVWAAGRAQEKGCGYIYAGG